MTTKYIDGRDGMSLIKKMFGIEQTAVTKIVITAEMDAAVKAEVHSLAKNCSDVSVTETTNDDHVDVRQFIIEVRELK